MCSLGLEDFRRDVDALARLCPGESQGGEEHDEVIPGVDGGLEGGALEPLEDASDRSEGDEEREGEENRDRQGIR